MTAVALLPSNQSGLRVAKEASLRVLPGSPIWNPQDPNSFSNFGGEIRNMERDPIRDDRQNAKGVTVGLSAAGEYTMDFTYGTMQFVLPSFFYANFRPKIDFGGAGQITSVTTTYNAGSGFTFTAGDLIFAAQFSTILGNNGLKRVTSATGTAVTTAETLTAETPPASATLVKVGKQFAAGAISVIVSGPLPVYSGPAGSFTGIIPGEEVYFGDGTDPLFSFATANCNGWRRVRAVAADGSTITVDKAKAALSADAGTTKTIRMYLGRVLKNETGTNIVRTSLQFERTLGAPDDALPTQVQSEYLIGAIGNQLDFEYKPQDKLTCTLSFMACDVEQRTGAVGVKSGTRPLLPALPALNTSSSVKRIRLASVSSNNVAPTPLAGECLNLKMSINNGLKPVVVIGFLGAFEIVPGNFKVTADMEFLFLTVAAQDAVRQNADVTLDMIHVIKNTAMVMDMPLLTLGDGRAKVVKDDPISIPITGGGNSGEEFDANLDHTLLMTFFDYVPDVASTVI